MCVSELDLDAVLLKNVPLVKKKKVPANQEPFSFFFVIDILFLASQLMQHQQITITEQFSGDVSVKVPQPPASYAVTIADL